MASSPITSWQIEVEKVEVVTYFIFLGSKITADGDCSHEIKRCLLLGRKATKNLGSVLKSRHITLLTKVHTAKAMIFSSGHVWMWELDHKEGWAPKNWYFQTVVLKKTLESPLDCKEIQPVHPKGNQSWIFIGRTDAETPRLWPLDVEWTHWKDPDDGTDWKQKERGRQKMRLLDSITDSMDMNLSKLQEVVEDRKVGVLESIESQRVRHDLVTEQQQQTSILILLNRDLQHSLWRFMDYRHEITQNVSHEPKCGKGHRACESNLCYQWSGLDQTYL